MMSFGSKPQNLFCAKIARTAFAAMIGAAVVIGCAGQGAFAADDEDDENPLIDTQIMRHIFKGLGWQRDEAGIEYRERSPLVLPGNKPLPKPEAAASAKKTAGWPDDPDVKRAKARRDAEKNRKAYTEGVDDRPLLPNEYARTSSGNTPKPTIIPGRSAEESEKPSTVYELGSKNFWSKTFGNKDEYATFTGEPPRQSLLEPPRGYRTPSPNQPYGVGKEKWIAPKVDRQEPVR
jgi:hypothetical protein